MRKPGRILLSLVPTVLCLLLAAGSATVFSACGMKEDGTWMRCHGAQDTVVLCAFILSAVLLFQAFLHQRILRVILNVIGVTGAVSIFLIPGNLMPMCMMHTMRCYTLFQPFVRIMSVLICLVCIANVIRICKGKKA